VHLTYIVSLSTSQAVTNVPDHFQINCILSKMAEHNGIQTVWVPGHMRIDGNETAHQLARLDSPHPLT
jgi:ribonuclease HI